MAMKPTDQEIGALYRESGEAEPSAALDCSILAAARAAVAVKPASEPWWKRWRLPVQALASVAVVGLLVLMMNQQQPEMPVVGDLALHTQPGEAPAQAAPRTLEEAKPAVADKAASVAKRAVARPAPAKEEAVMAPAAAPAASAVAEAEVSASRSLSSARAPLATAPATRAAQGDEALGRVEAPNAEAKVAARPAAAVAPRPAKEWLESIQTLVSQGRIEEARASLESFERAHPSVVVPETLRKQLK